MEVTLTEVIHLSYLRKYIFEYMVELIQKHNINTTVSTHE